MTSCVSLTIPAKAEYLQIVRLALFGVATGSGFSFEEIEDMKVAVAEACNNAVIHAYGDNEQGTVEVNFEMEETEMRIRIKDEGNSFDGERLLEGAESHHNKELQDIHPGGLGIFMMQALMDKVQVVSYNGTEVILTKLHTGKEEVA